ncbi:hypothetical protein B1748_30155 [Paenibacillus sp. MY03]|uniref:hypothetical protein n=1 Tax=Paenibacillus sp. MY03 TaxID=302980 RepID=UPI000B3D27AF|nr:hypothetical protein [Paenibacillus sp. MY03]OUS69773.1 hypothetical protein B1748_30155 [Paenibacillus sp. MY03]
MLFMQSNSVEILEEGIKIGVAICLDSDLVAYEVSSIPAGVKLRSYCYATADGFYENPDYNRELDPTVEELKAELAMQKASNEDLILMVAEIVAAQ